VEKLFPNQQITFHRIGYTEHFLGEYTHHCVKHLNIIILFV
jgi:hypothetical protein